MTVENNPLLPLTVDAPESSGGLLNYCRIKLPLGVGEAIKGNTRALLRRGRDLPRSLLPTAESTALGSPNTEFVTFQKAAPRMRTSPDPCAEPEGYRCFQLSAFTGISNLTWFQETRIRQTKTLSEAWLRTIQVDSHDIPVGLLEVTEAEVARVLRCPYRFFGLVHRAH